MLFKIPKKPELSENKTIYKENQVIQGDCDENKKQNSDPPSVFFRDMEQFIDKLFHIEGGETRTCKNN